MIKSIQLSNVATYGSTAEEMADLAKINFIYGSNGRGRPQFHVSSLTTTLILIVL